MVRLSGRSGPARVSLRRNQMCFGPCWLVALAENVYDATDNMPDPAIYLGDESRPSRGEENEKKGRCGGGEEI
jgi:hypothetical protein